MVKVTYTAGNSLHCACCRFEEKTVVACDGLNEALLMAAELKASSLWGEDITYIQVWDGDTAIGLDNDKFQGMVNTALRRIHKAQRRKETQE